MAAVTGDFAGGPCGDLSGLADTADECMLDGSPTSARLTPRIMQRLYRVQLDRSKGAPLGLSVQRTRDQTLLITRVSGGLVEDWNEAEPEAFVRAGDRVLQVNGLRGDASALLRECEQPQMLDLILQRARCLVDLQSCYGELEAMRSEGGARSARSMGEEIAPARGCAEADEAAGKAEHAAAAEGAPLTSRAQQHDSAQPGGVPDGYSGEGLLRQLLAERHAVLVRGSYLAELARCQGVLPRRQELPVEAIWTVHGRKLPAEVAAVSYCWLTPEHPDPEGLQLRKLGKVIEGYRASTRRDIAVFIDWCSLYQHPRSPEEQASFMQSLCHASLWYAHRQTWKWMLTALPDGAPGRPGYRERGWPTFEYVVSQLAGVPERLLDLGRLEDDAEDWQGVLATCACGSREPPRAPEAFAKLLESKVFTNSVDRGFLEAAYRRAFEDLVASAEVLDFSCLGWGDEELQRLAQALPLCSGLRRLYLSWNKAGDPGAKALAAVLPRCSGLCKLGLAGNRISDAAKSQLRESWRSAGKREDQLDLW